MWKPENNRCLPLCRVFDWTQSSFGSGNQPSTWDIPVSTILGWSSRYKHSCLAFYMGAGDLNSGPHTCRESTPANWAPSPITKDCQECCGTNFLGETQHTHHTHNLLPQIGSPQWIKIWVSSKYDLVNQKFYWDYLQKYEGLLVGAEVIQSELHHQSPPQYGW